MRNILKNILVTNDDGVTSPGLLALVHALRPLGQVTVLAPDRNWSATGHGRTLDRPLRVRSVELLDGSRAYSSDGSPSDCVFLGLRGFLEKKIDLVVSGINTSANMGEDVTYSGTVGAAMESVIWGVPAVAVSLDAKDNYTGVNDYAAAAHYGAMISQRVLENGVPERILLNVNVPDLKLEEIRGIKIANQGRRIYYDEIEMRLDPKDHPYYWAAGKHPAGLLVPDTDIEVVSEGYVAVSPMQTDLTAHQLMNHFQDWSWEKDEHKFFWENELPIYV